MSGGSMDYLYSRVEDAYFRLDTPERRAFKAHLKKIAQALHAIEWVDSGDKGPGDETEAIRACLSDGAVLAQVADDARRAMAELQAELERAKR
jgi:hypothetical protein